MSNLHQALEAWADHVTFPECTICRELQLATADAVLAHHPGRTEQEIKAGALRHAANDLESAQRIRGEHPYTDAGWLRHRADRIENGEKP